MRKRVLSTITKKLVWLFEWLMPLDILMSLLATTRIDASTKQANQRWIAPKSMSVLFSFDSSESHVFAVKDGQLYE